MEPLYVVILAAGKGERMVSGKPKVMHEVMGRPMIDHVVKAALGLRPARIVVVTGHGREVVEDHLKESPVSCTIQTEQKGTAHALLSAEYLLGEGDILVLYGDVPLIEEETLRNFLAFYELKKRISFMTTDVQDPAGYGRVILSGDTIEEIREDADATPEEKKIRRINTGICIIPRGAWAYIKEIKSNNKKGEYYLTDICKVARNKGAAVGAYNHEKASEVLGINSRKELLAANVTMKGRTLERHMKKGVSVLDSNVYIDSDVEIGMDTTVSPNCYIFGKTVIGKRVFVGPNTIIRNCIIHDDVVVDGFTVLEDTEIMTGARVGPFSRLRLNTVVEANASVGNFVEVKNSRLGKHSKANHLTYLGDARIGENVNIGAGTITCNYDGVKKHRTIIEDNVFVGSNTELVAPVSIGKEAFIGAGSTITKDVPEGALAITRVEQKHIEGYTRRKKCAE